MKSNQCRRTFQVVRKNIPEHKCSQKLSVTSKVVGRALNLNSKRIKMFKKKDQGKKDTKCH